MTLRQKIPRWSMRGFLERSGLWLSRQAGFTLITLVIFLGTAVGLWRGRPPGGIRAQGLDIPAVCNQVSIAFAASATAGQIKELLRSKGGYIVHGPDEFGVYQLRFAEAARTDAARQLSADAVIASVRDHANCP
jgi:hypothetical protein